MSTQTFTSSGTWICPGGVSTVQVECWAAGGGGGGPFQAGASNESGGGGGGGAYAVATAFKVVPGNVYTVNVGNGGGGGASGTNGNPGGDTWFSNPGMVLAKGGAGGMTGGGVGGAGGNSIGCIGDSAFTGGSGGAGQVNTTNVGGAGAGSSAGNAGNGNNGVDATGTTGTAGGAAPTGGAAGGAGGTGGAGIVGAAPGGGGGSTAGAFTNKSGAGAAGQVILTWTAVSGPLSAGTEIYRRDEDPDPGHTRSRVLRIFNPMLAPAYSQPVIRPMAIVREIEPVATLPAPLQILRSPQIAVRAVATPSISRGVMLVRSITHELERVGAAIVQFIRPRIVLVDTGVRLGSARMLYRVFNPAVYRFYRSSTATPPQPGDVPYATSATLPNQPATTFADGTWLISVSYFNGVLDSGFLPLGPRGETYITLTIAAGVAQATLPGAPVSARLEVRAGGVIRVIAYYIAGADGANAGDTWGLSYTTNGATPPSGAAGLTQAMTAGPFQILSYDLPAQADGTTVKVQLQTIRSAGSVYSPPGPVLSAVAVASGPSGPLGITDWPGLLPLSPEDLA